MYFCFKPNLFLVLFISFIQIIHITTTVWDIYPKNKIIFIHIILQFKLWHILVSPIHTIPMTRVTQSFATRWVWSLFNCSINIGAQGAFWSAIGDQLFILTRRYLSCSHLLKQNYRVSTWALVFTQSQCSRITEFRGAHLFSAPR